MVKRCTLLLLLFCSAAGAKEVRIGTFQVDATPPVGAPLAYDPMQGTSSALTLRGVVLAGSGPPIVLCAVDWIGIGGGGQAEFRQRLAEAAGTTPERVAVHTLHQHDAPRCNFAAEQILAHYGHGGVGFDPVHARDVAGRAADAVATAVRQAVPVTHVGLGQAAVERVASNRRILGEDGKVKYTRWTATKDPALRALPTGVIDPQLKLISFHHCSPDRESPGKPCGEDAVAALTYYATHPQSYYRTGLASVDFPGLARNARQQQSGVAHVHFNGAGGNVTAGKWNDGSKENRQVLAGRVEAAMRSAWDGIELSPLAAAELQWNTVAVKLPLAAHLDEASLIAELEDKQTKPAARYAAAKSLAWLRACRSGEMIDVGCLTLGRARVLHLPGELFVEYQLAAQQQRPDLFVAMAAYGDYSPGYIGTKIAYGQGGYETSPRASRVAPAAEDVLMDAIGRLLKSP